MRNDIEFKYTAGKRLDEHPSVLLRRSTDGEMIEGKYSITVKRLDPVKEITSRQLVECAAGVGKRSVQQQKRPSAA